MISKTTLSRAEACGMIGTMLVAYSLTGCVSEPEANAPSSATTRVAAQSTETVIGHEPVEEGGAQLWAQNCMRCHNYRTPASLGDREWRIVMRHMRVRAGLTAEEHVKILQFLQAAN